MVRLLSTAPTRLSPLAVGHRASQNGWEGGLVQLQQQPWRRGAGRGSPRRAWPRPRPARRSGRPPRRGRPAPGSGCGSAPARPPASTGPQTCTLNGPGPVRGRLLHRVQVGGQQVGGRGADPGPAGRPASSRAAVVSTGRSTSSAAVRPVMSAPDPRPGSSGRCGRSGSSPRIMATASAGSVPGMDPIPVAAAGAMRTAVNSSPTQQSLAGGTDNRGAVIRSTRLTEWQVSAVPPRDSGRVDAGLAAGSPGGPENSAARSLTQGPGLLGVTPMNPAGRAVPTFGTILMSDRRPDA